MDPEEETYVNMNDLDEWRAPEEKTKPVRTHAVAKEETGSGRPLKLAAACLGLVCVVLMTTAIAVSVQYVRDYNQLFRDLIMYGSEYQQLLLRYQNLTNERDQLQISLNVTGSELERMIKNTATCPDGWRKFGCSCYFLFTKHTTWGPSKEECTSKGADLVIINSKEEMMFLNNLGFPKMFWIGLISSSDGSNWTWADGSSPKVMHWKSQNTTFQHHSRGQMCAAFNRFAAGRHRLDSWSKEHCTQDLQFICEKEAQVPFLP
ncbi:C-type lectin domain family 9 member A-like [Genypterus blacodes]|uniref:C-type lectin domain family 9 member A-like n=1 Tax=Genypterus blacodes TaxID=154954 RepID=UPI003F76D1C1